MVDFLLRPGAFFAGRQPRVGSKGTLRIILVLGLGIALNSPEKINRIADADGAKRFLASMFFSLFVAGPLYWWLGGLWCMARIRWAGEPEPDRDRASMIFGMSEMVIAVPMIAWAVLDMALSPSPWMSLPLILVAAWSQFVSYQAVRATFPVVSLWKARVWFLIVPVLGYAAMVLRPFWQN